VGEFDVAANLFAEVAKNPESHWHDGATYVKVRTRTCKGTVGDGKGNLEKAAFIAAERILRPNVADPAQAKFKSAAERRLELVTKLTRPGLSANFDQDKSDLFWLLDRLGWTLGAKDDLTNWISSMKLKSPQVTDEAIAQWQKAKSRPGSSRLSARWMQAGPKLRNYSKPPTLFPQVLRLTQVCFSILCGFAQNSHRTPPPLHPDTA
jgi:hypothetical protein